MKSLLIFPPYWCPSHPYLSLPCLTAFLKKNNIKVNQKDINIESIQYFLSSKFIKKCKGILKNKYENIDIKQEVYIKDIMLCDYICNNIDLAVQILKDKEDFYNIEKYNFASNIIKHAFEIISKAYYPTCINLNYVKLTQKLNFKEIENVIINKDVNPFIEFYEEIITKLELESINFIAISLIAFEQLTPVLTLCNFIKKRYPKIHITLGGSVLSKLISKLDKLSNIWLYTDSIILFEGEYPLLKLIQTINNDGNLKDVPNLVYWDKNSKKVIKNDIGKVTDINKLPVPCFDELPLNKYLSGERILPYYISRSCCWGKCAFCDHDYGYDGIYRVKDMKKVVRELIYLKETYNVMYFHIIDEALPPKIIDMFCNEIINQNLKINWFNYIRADSKFTDELCEKMKKCGCIEIMIGVESCSDKVIKDMNKGNCLRDIKTTLYNMNKNQIWNHVFLINNFPTETIKDKFLTMQYVLSNKNLFNSIGIGNFTLGINSKIIKNLDYYNIKLIKDVSDFSTIYYYELKNNYEDNDSLKNISSIFLNNIETNYFHNKILIYREHLPLYAQKYEIIKNKDILYKLNYGIDIYSNKKYHLEKIIFSEYEQNIIVYSLKTHKIFLMPKSLKFVLQFFQYDRILDEVKEFFKNNFDDIKQKQILNFLNDKLILNRKINNI